MIISSVVVPFDIASAVHLILLGHICTGSFIVLDGGMLKVWPGKLRWAYEQNKAGVLMKEACAWDIVGNSKACRQWRLLEQIMGYFVLSDWHGICYRRWKCSMKE